MKSTIKKHLTILLLAGIGGSLHAQQAPPPDPYRTVLVAGTVEAVNAVKVESKLDGTSTIVWVVEEGAMVKKGDPLVELDPSALKEKINSAEIGRLVASRNLAKASGELEVAKTSNALGTKVARNAHQTAEANLKHFQSIGMKTTAEDLQARVAVAAERIRAAEKILALKGNPALQVEVINAQAALLEAQRVLKLAQAELKQFQEHTAPQLLRDLQLAVAVAEAEVTNAEVKNKATLGAASHEVDLEQNKLRAAESSLAGLKEQVANAKIVAPMDGLVIYHVGESSRYGGSSSIIEKGANVRKGQGILKITDMKNLNVVVKVHESKRHLVFRGSPVSIKLDTLPGQPIRGVVSYISPVASAAERWGSNKKVFKTEIRLLDLPARLYPGASVIAEITIKVPRPGGIRRPAPPTNQPGNERPGSGPRPSGGGGGRGGGIMDLDADKNGKVSKVEYGKLDERVRQFMGEFSALDTNGDGGITKKEADAARQKLMERIRSGGSPPSKKAAPRK